MDTCIIFATSDPAELRASLEGAARVTAMLRAVPNTIAAGILELVAALIDPTVSPVSIPAAEVPADATWVLHEAADLLDTIGDAARGVELRRFADVLATGAAAPEWAPLRAGEPLVPSGLTA